MGSLFFSSLSCANMVVLSNVVTTPVCVENMDETSTDVPFSCTLDVSFDVRECNTVSTCSTDADHYDVDCKKLNDKIPFSITYYLKSSYCADLNEDELYRLFKMNQLKDELDNELPSPFVEQPKDTGEMK